MTKICIILPPSESCYACYNFTRNSNIPVIMNELMHQLHLRLNIGIWLGVISANGKRMKTRPRSFIDDYGALLVTSEGEARASSLWLRVKI